MTELERARAHLRSSQYDLAKVRKANFHDQIVLWSEANVLAALSWVWEEQEKAAVPESAPWHYSKWRVIRLETLS